METSRADLVLEGGGVKGIALAGAIEVLEERGYRFGRVAGSSAGAIAGALVAADVPAADLVGLLREIDYEKFCDGPWWTRPLVGKAVAILVRKGVHRGKYVGTWLADQLAEHSQPADPSRPFAFADLPYHDPEGESPDQPVADGSTSGYAAAGSSTGNGTGDGTGDGTGTVTNASRLVVTASDVTAGRLRLLPRDAGRYGMTAADLPVADAVRASTAMPFFFRPVRWTTSQGRRAHLVDGGMLSNFPVGVFDRADGALPRWPTFGIKLSARPPADPAPVNRIRGALSYALALLDTLIGARDRMHIDDPHVQARTIFIDTSFVKPTQFDLTDEDREKLYRTGRQAATDFLDGTATREGWDFEEYVARYRTGARAGAEA
ncbi:patatin-like phospholipase family protein [Brachybacterium sp. MASK1Z-5]|uniref:Patatin-like phospholipase family protein n=1 Tax=Brachybacterium halotolerans TaxID=2795215 RepID=A0ABS1B7X6_9MICO|nr:patatin-like phospholipase family protein [Brachybacterium halotolerans]MBK0330741.1 patatin-like phospholipase family protein [Brachybacterium halotolerans]